MGKNLIQQARGKGGPTYRSPGFRYHGAVKLPTARAETVQGTIMDLQKDPGHSAPLAHIEIDGTMHLLPAPEGVKIGDMLYFGGQLPIQPGNALCLKDIPEGTMIYNIENRPGDGGKFCRSAGTCAKIVSRIENGVLVLLPSKKQRLFLHSCRAIIGIPAGGGQAEKPLLKAGNAAKKYAAKNKRYPIIGGNSQNAVDHPFGKSRTGKKGRPTIAPKNAPPGGKVGKLHPRQTGRGKR